MINKLNYYSKKKDWFQKTSRILAASVAILSISAVLISIR